MREILPELKSGDVLVSASGRKVRQEKIYKKHWAKNHLEQMRAYRKKWADNNPEKREEGSRRWAREHPEKVKARKRRWYLNNYEKVKEQTRRWKQNHPEKVLAAYKKSRKKQRLTPRGNLENRMRCQLWGSLRENKAGRRWESLIGYTLGDLIKHIESLFKSGMTWNAFLLGQIDIHHIIPLHRFQYKTAEEPEFKVCWGLQNLEPLWKSDHIKKHQRDIQAVGCRLA